MRRRNALARAVEALLRDRRPRRFRADADEAAQLRTAALLRSAHPGADMPSSEFVDRLAQQLRKEVTREEATTARPPLLAGRRAFLRGAGLAAAAVAAGVGVDRAVVTLRSSSSTPSPSDMNVPEGGWWAPVATLTAVRSTPALRFRAGSVEGVLVARPDGGVDALSAVCTHLGCLLNVDAGQRRLVCPCHEATFSLEGAPSSGEYLKAYLRPLPRLQSRINGEHVEVFVA